MIFIFSLLGVSGCASSLDRSTDYKGDDAGNLVLSLGVSNEEMQAYSPMLSGRKIETKDPIELTYEPPRHGEKILLDIPFTDGAGKVIVRRLPPGKYQIDQYHFSISNDEVRISNKLVTPVVFSISSGQTAYIGSVYLYMKNVGSEEKNKTPVIQLDGKTQTYMRMQAEVTDEQERDIANAKSSHPDMNIETVTNFVPKQKKVGL